MKFLSIISIISFATLSTMAELPKKRSTKDLSRLSRNSPFTTKPVVETKEAESKLKDWSLIGVSANPPGGHTVSIAKKNDRQNRIIIHSNGQYAEKTLRVIKSCRFNKSLVQAIKRRR